MAPHDMTAQRMALPAACTLVDRRWAHDFVPVLPLHWPLCLRWNPPPHWGVSWALQSGPRPQEQLSHWAPGSTVATPPPQPLQTGRQPTGASQATAPLPSPSVPPPLTPQIMSSSQSTAPPPQSTPSPPHSSETASRPLSSAARGDPAAALSESSRPPRAPSPQCPGVVGRAGASVWLLCSCVVLSASRVWLWPWS